ncbi:MAG: TRAP transporter small permease, partial [Desulfovibrio sp.]|nr:TRAP transporter small permease [Desulfovibrio sp.]
MNTFLIVIEKILKAIVAGIIGLMLFWVFAQVITRYVFNYTPSFGEELARYMFVWVVFLSLPIVAKKGGHMAIEMITVRLRGSALWTVNLIADACTLIFLALMVWHGAGMVMRASFQTSPALQISMSWVYLAIPIGCGIMLLNVLQHFLTLLRPGADGR